MAVSKPSPNSDADGYIFHGASIRLAYPPKRRFIRPRLSSWRSRSSSLYRPLRMARRIFTMPTRITALSAAMRYRNVPETVVPMIPVTVCNPEPPLPHLTFEAADAEVQQQGQREHDEE